MVERMGEFGVLSDMTKSIKKHIPTFIFLCLWVIPFTFLFRDFFNFEDASNILNPRILRILSFTTYQAVLSTLFSLIITFLPAYYASKSRGIISKLLDNSVFIPFFFPPISAVVAFSLLYSSTGILSKLGLKINVMYTLAGIIIAHIFYNSPIFVRYISEGLKRIPKNFKEAAYIEGAGRFKTFLSIELPLIMPSISRAFFLVFTYNFTSFAIVLNIGGIKYSTLEVAIANTLRGTFNFSKALSYAFIQLLILTIINVFMSKFEPITFDYESESENKIGIFSQIISIIYLIFEYSIVTVGIVSAFFNFVTMKFDLSGFINIFSKELNQRFPVIQSIFNSIFVSIISAGFSIIVAYYLLKNYSKFTNVAVMSTLSISSAFLGMSLLYLNILFNISYFALIILGYFLITVPLSYSFLFQPILSFDDSIIEAAKIDGASIIKIFSKIELPLLFPAFLSAFLQVFAIIYGEFTIGYTMQIRDFFPLVSIVNYTLSSSRLYLESNALSALNIVIVFFIFYLSNKLIKKRKN